MGSAASVAAALQAVPDSSLQAALADVPKEQAARLLAALHETGSELGRVDVVVTLLSGTELPCLKADVSWTGSQVKLALARHLDKEALVKELRTNEQVLRDGQRLKDLGLGAGACCRLQGILERRPEHTLWLQFQQCCDKYIHRILIADAVEAASRTIRLIRDVEESYEDAECGDSSGMQLGRVQMLLMAQDQRQSSSEHIFLMPPDGSHTDVSLIVEACQLHNIDAVIVGSGAVAGGDVQLVQSLKKKLAEAGLQILVFGPSSSVDTPVTEPGGGWTELSTTPPFGTRVGDTYCLNCQERCDAEIGEYLSCHINPEAGESGFQQGHPCSSWLHCVRCGGAVDPPFPGWWGLIRFDRRYVFRSSHPEAGDATFALCIDDENVVVYPAVQRDGEWLPDDDCQKRNHWRAECYEEFDSYMERIGALWITDTTNIRPGEQITFKLCGYRRLAEPEAKERARVAGEEDAEIIKSWYSAEAIDIKTGKWMGLSHGIHWDDDEVWHVLGTLKYQPEEE